MSTFKQKSLFAALAALGALMISANTRAADPSWNASNAQTSNQVNAEATLVRVDAKMTPAIQANKPAAFNLFLKTEQSATAGWAKNAANKTAPAMKNANVHSGTADGYIKAFMLKKTGYSQPLHGQMTLGAKSLEQNGGGLMAATIDIASFATYGTNQADRACPAYPKSDQTLDESGHEPKINS